MSALVTGKHGAWNPSPSLVVSLCLSSGRLAGRELCTRRPQPVESPAGCPPQARDRQMVVLRAEFARAIRRLASSLKKRPGDVTRAWLPSIKHTSLFVHHSPEAPACRAASMP